MGRLVSRVTTDIETLDRVRILRDLRRGEFDVLVGVNLLREGLDLPEVSLVAILDADKEGFLRSRSALIQTSGRAARNINGTVIFYADQVTKSMQSAMDEMDRRRTVQAAYNKEHNITPRGVVKPVTDILEGAYGPAARGRGKGKKVAERRGAYAVDVANLTPAALARKLKQMEDQMYEHAKNLEFEDAARLRDELTEVKQRAFIQ